MAYYRCGGGGIPSGIKTDMNAVLNKKFGTSTDYPPAGWADTVNLMGVLPVRTVTGAIATCTDGADSVPIANGNFAITPTLSGVSGMVISHCGKNLWDEEWEIGRIDTTTGQNVSDSNYIRSTNYIPVKGDLSYYLNIAESTTLWAAILTYDKDKNFISNLGGLLSKRPFTTPSNCAYLRFYVTGNYGTTYNNDISINYPSTETEYNQYNGDTSLVDFGQTIYGGSYNSVSGVLTESYGMVDLGSLTWTYNSTRTRFETSSLVDTIQPTPNNNTPFNGVCADYTIVSASNVQGTNNSIGVTNISTLLVHNDNYTDATAFKNAMSGIYLVYELAQPTETQIAPTPINSRLAVNNWWCDSGDSEITYRRDIELALGGN